MLSRLLRWLGIGTERYVLTCGPVLHDLVIVAMSLRDAIKMAEHHARLFSENVQIEWRKDRFGYRLSRLVAITYSGGSTMMCSASLVHKTLSVEV